MNVTLTKEELEHISNFIKAKGVSYSDVNAEMTDHIASEVEELINQDNLSFVIAVKQVFLKYGRFHFMKIEEEKVKKLQNQSWLAFRKGFLNFFSFPKIIFTICLFFTFKKLTTYSLNNYLGYAYVVIAFVLLIIIYFLKRNILGKGTYLQLAKFNWIFVLLINLGMQIMIGLSNLTLNLNTWLLSGITTILFLFLFIAIELYINEFKKLKNNYIIN